MMFQSVSITGWSRAIEAIEITFTPLVSQKRLRLPSFSLHTHLDGVDAAPHLILQGPAEFVVQHLKPFLDLLVVQLDRVV